GWGIVSMEASASGTPTIASDSPGLRETVRHAETGYLVPHGDVGALARALERVMRLEDCNRLGRAARSMAEEHSWGAMADSFEDLLLSLAERTRTSGGLLD
ncbi:MAG: glycosyltransferase, partial [Gemmatimonadota bacterium]|nr:glycosyltransferase [Gemmatimonadota bacterium]